MSNQPSPNFAFLAHHDARLVALATQAEEYFATDPPTSIGKLRLFAEVLAKLEPQSAESFTTANRDFQASHDIGGERFEERAVGGQ